MRFVVLTKVQGAGGGGKKGLMSHGPVAFFGDFTSSCEDRVTQ